MDRIKDINDDGIDDILIASFTSGATLMSGADGNTIWTHPMEYQFAIQSISDIDGDGYEDVLVGTGNSSPTFGNFYAISGKKDSVLFNQYFATDKVYSVHAIESIDGNASSDMVIGTREGLVYCYSGGLDVVTALNNNKNALPGSYQLEQNYPNPFNPVTTISFTLPSTATVNLRVYNVLGQLVAAPVQRRGFEAGTHEVQFDASNLTSGMYIYQLESDLGILYRRMILLK